MTTMLVIDFTAELDGHEYSGVQDVILRLGNIEIARIPVNTSAVLCSGGDQACLDAVACALRRCIAPEYAAPARNSGADFLAEGYNDPSCRCYSCTCCRCGDPNSWGPCPVHPGGV